ncbi:unnamed protein product, partial [Allacma fusca]
MNIVEQIWKLKLPLASFQLFQFANPILRK